MFRQISLLHALQSEDSSTQTDQHILTQHLDIQNTLSPTHLCVHTQAQLHTHTHKHTHIHTHYYKHTHACSYTHTQLHTLLQTNTHTHTHTRTNRKMFK